MKERVVCVYKDILDLQNPGFDKNNIKNPKERDLCHEVFTKVN